MTALFVTGSDTAIGKTLGTAALITQLRGRGMGVRALKPVISGYSDAGAAQSDSGVLLTALGEAVTRASVEAVSPWRYAAPLAPDMAAAREGRTLDFAALVGFCRDAIASAGAAGEVLLIEGVGGVMAPLTERETVADWIAAAGAPALLVAGSYLGGLSHALTAAEALARRDIEIAAVIVSESAEPAVPLDETVATLGRFLAPVPVAPLPRLAPCERSWLAAPDLVGPAGIAGKG